MKKILQLLKKGFGTGDDSMALSKGELKSSMPPTPALREAIIGFVIQSLQAYVDEKALSVRGLNFYIICNNPQQEEAARAALYLDSPGMFKTAVLERKLLNHFIQFEQDWSFECRLVKDGELPVTCIRKAEFGLQVVHTGEPVTGSYLKAMVQVLTGQAEQEEYILDPLQQLKFYIGRTTFPQLSSGKVQQNDIVFLGTGDPGFNELIGSPNLRISRNHAYIVFDTRANVYRLYADRGGLPENGNKLKVHTGDDKVKWLNLYGVSHCLCDGDQVELGGAAVFRFKLLQ